jgi:outer membrane protein assembly factor BamB
VGGCAQGLGGALLEEFVKDSEEERIVCFAAQDGKPLWQHRYQAAYGDLDYGKDPRATPLIFEGRVYTLGAVGHLLCLSAASGEVIWRKQIKDDFGARQPMWGFAASPIMHGNQLILHIGAEDGSFVALDPANGALIWRGGTDPCGYATPIVIQHQGQDTLIGWTPENVLGLNPQNGDVYWKIPYPVTYGVSIATPIFDEGLVVVSGYWEGTKAIRLGERPKDAQLAWEDGRWLRGLMAQPLYRDGHLYVLDKHHGVVCCKIATGERLWTDDNQLTPPGRNPHASIVWAGEDGTVLALNSAGALVLARFTPQGYTELGRTTIVGETWAHPAFSGPYVFARDDEQIVCVRLVP